MSNGQIYFLISFIVIALGSSVYFFNFMFAFGCVLILIGFSLVFFTPLMLDYTRVENEEGELVFVPIYNTATKFSGGVILIWGILVVLKQL